MSQPALVISYWLHMAATVTWIGGLFFQSIVIPVSLSSGKLDLRQQASLLEAIRKRFEPIAWLSLFILVGTGLVQMSANPSYVGLLALSGRWATALFAKHVAVGLMVVVAAAQTWVIQPRINRLILQMAKAEADSEEAKPLLKRQKTLHQLNFILAILVLGFTAIARSS
jgi:uncharacterized membrane protein